MKSVTVHLNQRRFYDGEYEPLFRFILRYVNLLDPTFPDPGERWLQQHGGVQDLGNGDFLNVWECSRNGAQGVRMTENETLESRASGIVVNGVAVEAFGLAEGCEFWTKHERSWSNDPYTELRVSGPEGAVESIAVRFREEFETRQMGQ